MFAERLDWSHQQALEWITQQSKLGSFFLGWLPRDSLSFYLHSRCCWVLRSQEELLAYAIVVSRRGHARILQIWTRSDCRRELFAQTLISQIFQNLANCGTNSVSCWCREDLEATLFWQALGFVPTAVRHGGKSKGKLHIKFAATIGDQTLGQLFERPPMTHDWRTNFERDSPMIGRALRRPFHECPLFLE